MGVVVASKLGMYVLAWGLTACSSFALLAWYDSLLLYSSQSTMAELSGVRDTTCTVFQMMRALCHSQFWRTHHVTDVVERDELCSEA